MAPKPAIHVEGLDELRRALRKAKNTELNQRLKDANKEIAIAIVRKATPMVPVLTGRLFKSLRGRGNLSGAVGKAGSASVPYAAVQHWGSTRKGITGRPFLWTAARQIERDVVDRYERHITRALDDINSTGPPSV